MDEDYAAGRAEVRRGEDAMRVSRRAFLRSTTAGGLVLAANGWTARLVGAQPSGPARPGMAHGVQSGDVGQRSAIVWSATDRPARMIVEYATTEAFTNAGRVVGPAALPETGHAAQVVLTYLPAGQEIFYRLTFQDLGDLRSLSVPVTGRFKTVPADVRDVSFAWSGDTAGQGWGISAEWGGMKIYEAMRRLEPDYFVHSGDMIFADIPIPAEVALPGRGTWRNLVTPEKAK